MKLATKKSLTLRSGAYMKKEEKKAKDEDEEINLKKRKIEIKSEKDMETILKSVKLEESQVKSSDMCIDSDDEWEDFKDEKKKKNREYNTLKLKNFSREVDRYKISNRAAAKLANGILKDIGLVKEGDIRMLIDQNKVRREREKWGRERAKEHSKEELPGAFYTDGKKTPTLVRDVTETKVRVAGGRGGRHIR